MSEGKEGGPGGGGGGVRVGSNMSVISLSDAQRRDFTINALYWNVLEDKIEDPLGKIVLPPSLSNSSLQVMVSQTWIKESLDVQ